MTEPVLTLKENNGPQHQEHVIDFGQPRWRRFVPENIKLYLVVSVCFLANLNMGQVLGFSAVLLPQLETERKVSATDASLIASLSNVGQLVVALSTSFLASLLGRKRTIISLSVVTSGGFLVATLSQGLTRWLIVSRVLQGAAIVCSVVQVYIAEISPTHLRSVFGALGTIGISAGIVVVYVLGAFLHWSYVAFICAQFPMFCSIFIAFFCPESPAWLVTKHRHDEAQQVLHWLRGSGHDVYEEMQGLQELNERVQARRDTTMAEMWTELTRPEIIKPCLLLVTLMCLMMANGATVIVFYAVSIIQDLQLTTNSYLPAILTGVMRLCGSIVGTLLLRKGVGKKKLLTVTSLVMSASVLLLGLHLHFRERLREITTDLATTTVLPILLLVVYMIAFGMGPVMIPWTLLGELVPPKVAPWTSSIAVSSSILTLYALTQSYPFLEQALSLAGTFWMYSGVSLVMASVSIFFLPETNGKSPREILAHFVQDHKRNMTRVEPVVQSASDKKSQVL